MNNEYNKNQKRDRILSIVFASVLILIIALAVIFGVFNQTKPNTDELTDTPNQDNGELITSEPEPITSPVFSLSEHFYDDSATLEFTYTDDYGAYEIYYTTDGTIPTAGSELYTEPIEIESTRRTVLYPYIARALHEDGTWSDSSHHTYIFGKFVKLDRFNTIVISLSTDPYNLYDYEYGIMIEGLLRDEWRYNNPKAEIIPPTPANYNLRGRESERPVHIEIFTKNGERVINQNGGIRIYGGWSRAHKQKSFKVFARKDYDEINWFYYNFFGDDYSQNGNLINRYKRFVVRNSGNDYGGAFIRDELFVTLARDSGFPDTERVIPVSVFMNGDYFGFYWLHDVYCDEYFEERYGKYDGQFAVLGNTEIYKEGEDEFEKEAAIDYREMYKYAYKDLTQDSIYNELCELLDVENYMMYCAINTYIDNTDWPHNNNKSYRYFAASGEEYRDEFPFDGKWRYMMHDTDHGGGAWGKGYNMNSVQDILKKDKSPMLMALMERDECREFFVTYMLDLLNGGFSEENFISRANQMNAARTIEMDNFLATSKYAPGASMSSVANNMKSIREFAENRPTAMIRNLRSTFKLGTTYTVDIINHNDCGVTVNTYTTYKSEFNGTYIIDYPTTINAVIPVGNDFSHWIVNGKTVYSKIINVQETSTIELILKDAEDNPKLIIDEISSRGQNDYIGLYNPYNVAISTVGYAMSDSYEFGKKPDSLKKDTVAPGESIVIYCDNHVNAVGKKNQSVSFSLKANETLTLLYKDEVYEQVKIPKISEVNVFKRDFLTQKFYETVPADN